MPPTHPFPAAANDARDVGVALLGSGSPLPGLLGVGVDPARFGTYGMSAGGYMSATCARQLAHLRVERR